MKKDINLIEALMWERDHGYLSAEECTRLIQEDGPPATVMVLQESQEPKSHAKDDGPPRFVDPIPLFSTGIDLSQYLQFKSQSPARRQPAVSASERGTKTLSEVELIEVRTQPYNAAAGGPVREAARRHPRAIVSRDCRLAVATKKPIDPYRGVGIDQPAMRVALPAKTAHDPSQAHTRGTRPSTVTNAILLGQQLAEALHAARTLMERTPTDPAVMVEQLRRWYYTQHPDERDRLLWQRFLDARSTHAKLEHAIQVAREALDVERSALVQVQAERDALAARPLPTTIEEEATNARPESVRRYQSLSTECQQRAAAITELERLLPAPEQALGPLTEAVTRVVEAVGTVHSEAFVHRVRESGELEQLRSRFERLRLMANTHAAEIDEWSQRVGRPLRVPRVVFPWPSAAIWDGLLAEGVEAPQLVWDEDPRRSGV